METLGLSASHQLHALVVAMAADFAGGDDLGGKGWPLVGSLDVSLHDPLASVRQRRGRYQVFY